MRVLMVCLGNICRSPMAEAWLIHKSQEHQLQIETDSAGTASYHIGEKPDARMRKHALDKGVSLEALRARQFTVTDFDQFDVIFAMDKSNLSNILRLARNDDDKQKVKLYLNELNPGLDQEVPDPYYGDDSNFIEVINLLEEATTAFLKNHNLI
jgi:protein-tyrosine phosphatase